MIMQFSHRWALMSVLIGSLFTSSVVHAVYKRRRVTRSVEQAAQPRKMTNRERQRERCARGLRRTYDAITTDLAPILAKYDVLKKAAPAGYAFYLQQLKSTIAKEVKQGHIPLYSTALFEFFHSWTLDEYQRSKEAHQSPLKRFKCRLLPLAIQALEVRQRFIKGCDLDAQVNTLIEKLTDLETII